MEETDRKTEMANGQDEPSKDKHAAEYVLSWNMQGAGGEFGPKTGALWRYLQRPGLNGKVRFACLQECSKIPAVNWKKDPNTKVHYATRRVSRSERACIFYYPWARTDSGNARCSLAVIVVGYDDPTSLDHAIVWSPQAVRPMVGVKANGLWVFSLHANSSNRAASSAKGLINEAVAKIVGSDDWLVAGDFNCQTSKVSGPWDIRKTDPAAVRSNQYFVQLPSQNIDFVVQKSRASLNSRLSMHYGRQVAIGQLISDHPAQIFQIWSTKGQ